MRSVLSYHFLMHMVFAKELTDTETDINYTLH